MSYITVIVIMTIILEAKQWEHVLVNPINDVVS